MAKTLPPIEDLPAARPVCQHCGRKLQPWCINQREKPYFAAIDRRIFFRWKGYDDRWCTLRCAHAFANAAWRAGYRITKKGQP